MIRSHSSSLRAQTFLETVLEEFDASDPEEALQLLRRMKKLLSQYYQERKTLQSLGLETLDDALDVMMAMRRRVETLEERLDAYQQAQEKLHAIQNALDVEANAEETVKTITNISQQLETLYEEKEVLSRAGLTDANEAVHMIQSMQEQLDHLYEDSEAAADASNDAFALLEEKLGVSDPESVIQMVESMEEQLTSQTEAPSDARASSPPTVNTLERQLLALQEGDVNIPTDEFATLIPFEDLQHLSERAPDDLNSFDVGILAVDDADQIQAANDYQPSVPGLGDNPVGTSLFDQVPASRNPLLQLPLQTARQNEVLDARLFYTFPHPADDGSPLPVKLQFYRSEINTVTWLLYSPL